MTHARALEILEASQERAPGALPSYSVNEYRQALAVAIRKLKPSKPRATKACPIAKAALKALTGCGIHVNEEAAYLDTFGPADSPEREAQRLRLRSLPRYAQFAYEGMPESRFKDPGAARMYLFGRMAQFERDEEADRLAKIRERAYSECRTLQRWAERNRSESERLRWYSGKPTAQWPRVEAVAA